MKHFLVFALLIFTATVFAQNYKQPQDAKTLGAEITAKDTVLISTLLAHPEKYVGKDVLVKGMVTDVCKKRGCWVKLASDKAYEDITIKVDDGVIVFPMEAKGKTAVAEGKFEAIELTKEHAIKYFGHKAEEQGKTFDPSTITGPVTIYRIKGTGAQIGK